MAEIELGVRSRQCLERRIPDRAVLGREVEAWQEDRNREAVSVNWRFSTEDARIGLKSLYPSIQSCSTTGFSPNSLTFPIGCMFSRCEGFAVSPNWTRSRTSTLRFVLDLHLDLGPAPLGEISPW